MALFRCPDNLIQSVSNNVQIVECAVSFEIQQDFSNQPISVDYQEAGLAFTTAFTISAIFILTGKVLGYLLNFIKR